MLFIAHMLILLMPIDQQIISFHRNTAAWKAQTWHTVGFEITASSQVEILFTALNKHQHHTASKCPCPPSLSVICVCMILLYSHGNSVTCVVLSLLIVDDSEAADLWLLNSCTVKNPSEDNFRNAIKRAQELDKHLVVAGCVPQGQPRHQSIKGISVIGASTF